MKKVRFGVVGVNGMGAAHAGYLKKGEVKNAELTAICDIDKAIGDRRAAEWDVPVFYNHKDLFNSGLIDAVIIATPHYFHPPIGMDAFKKGIHVISEKPMAVTVGEARKFARAAEKHPELRFACMFQMRTSHTFRKMKEMIDKGMLGEIYRVIWQATMWFRPQAYYDSGGWRATWDGEGGGVLLNQAPHQLDMFTWLCGMPNKCTAKTFLHHGHDIQTEDDTMAFFEFPNGATGLFVTSTRDYPGTDRLEICGETGRLVFLNGKLTYDKIIPGVRRFSDETDSAWSQPKCETIEVEVPTKGRSGHSAVTQNFVDSILKGTPLIAPGVEGVNGVELANAMILSGIRGKDVKIPVNAREYDEFLAEMIAKNKGRKKGGRRVKNTGPEFHKV